MQQKLAIKMKILTQALLIGLLITSVAFAQTCWAQTPEAFSMIIIAEDGSITCANLPDLSILPIKQEGEVYTLTGNIKSYGPGISIGRSGIVLDGAGYTLQGSAEQNGNGGSGISFAVGVGEVTVKNLKITNFDTGVSVNGNSGNSFIGNDVSNNQYNGYCFSNPSFNNTISGNKISNNPRWGIIIVGREPLYGGPSTGNRIFGNTIQDNGWEKSTIPAYGMDDDYGAGVWLWAAVNNTFYGNKFVHNAQQAFIFDHGVNTWSTGLPTGGNFWSDYGGVDANGDGIGDSPYIIDDANSDPYPLVPQSSTNPLPDESPNETQTGEGSQFPIEYVIDIVGLLVIVIVTLLVVFKRKRK
jgi:hypothetical protein